MEKERKKKLEEEELLQKRREIADQHERTFLSVSSIGAMPESADEKSDKESDTEYSGTNNSNKYVIKRFS